MIRFDDDVGRREDQQHALDHRVVAPDRIASTTIAPKSRDCEHTLGHGTPPSSSATPDTDDGDDGTAGVRQRMRERSRITTAPGARGAV